MSSTITPQQPASALTTTGRRRRYERAHPYPELPRSRLPLVRAVIWLVIAAIAALVRFLTAPIRRRFATPAVTQASPRESAPHPRRESRTPRMPLAPRAPSLTPL